MNFDNIDTAVVMIDPQNEVLSETGLAWPLLHESLHENNIIENIESIFKAAKEYGFGLCANGDDFLSVARDKRSSHSST